MEPVATREVKEYFEEESSSYERIRWKGSFVSRYDYIVTKESLTSLVERVEILLDLGCGPGVWLENLSDRYKIGVGVDISRQMLRISRGKGLGNTNFIVADCHNLPFREGAFEAVISSRVFIYLDLDRALSETKRVLRNGGYVVLLVQNERRSMYHMLRERLRKSSRFLKNASYLTTHMLLGEVSRYFTVLQTRGVIFHEHISPSSLDSRPVSLLLRLYLKMLYFVEKKLANTFLKHFYASSIAIKARKVSNASRHRPPDGVHQPPSVQIGNSGT